MEGKGGLLFRGNTILRLNMPVDLDRGMDRGMGMGTGRVRDVRGPSNEPRSRVESVLGGEVDVV